MEKTKKSSNIQKFMTLETKKRDRILNAAMKEFRYGYKKASTDAIVREAGISKGLLFHYFGTKDQLYEFLVKYAMDVVVADQFNMLNMGHQDILEGFWQVALLKRDITEQYPSIYNFLEGVNTYREDLPRDEILDAFFQKQESVAAELFSQCDTSLFREDIDFQKAVALICWAMNGFFDSADARISSSEEGWGGQNYENFLEELRGFLDIIRLCFYK